MAFAGLRSFLLFGLALNAAQAQHATVSGRIVLRDNGQPLGYTTIALLSQGRQTLASDSGTFTLHVSPGEVRLRFKRIGFVPKDTAFTLAAGDVARVRIEMTRLVIQLPEVVVDGTCTDRTPLDQQPVSLAALFDQVKQNAERMRLLAAEKPFDVRLVRVNGYRDRDNKVVGDGSWTDTVTRSPLPEVPYKPRGVIYDAVVPQGDGRNRGVKLPELPDLADTAFTNNHCFNYAGQTRFEGDSVIRVDFEPVPWLAQEVDIEGYVYLRVSDYQLVGLVSWLNRIPSWNRVLRDYAASARFRELVSGIPMVTDWVLTNTFRDGRRPYVQDGTVIGVTWKTP